MKKLKSLQIAAAAAIVMAGTTFAGAATIIGFDDANVGNGKLLNDITVDNVVYQQGQLINEDLPGNIFHNSDGRSLIQYGVSGYNDGGAGDMSDVTNILNNAGVVINGFTVYQGEYSGGNNSLGFLENGTRLGAAGNEAGNGDAFANAGEFFLFSDVVNTTVSPSDTIDISFQGGSDNGSADFAVYLLIDGATAGTQIGATQTGNAAGDPRLSFTATGLTASTSVQLAVAASTSDNSRSLIDNVSFEITPVPEPSSIAIGLLSACGFAAVAMRRRLG